MQPGVFASAAAILAKAKNRNCILWFRIGLVLGPFAVIKPGPGLEQSYQQVSGNRLSLFKRYMIS